MCDTLYAGTARATTGATWFAKNSDRSPDEAQALCLVPRTDPSKPLRVGGRDFPNGTARYAIALSKPSWMEGGEMGLNEAGVAIGNEAVFSRWAPAKAGILGMDILRAALSVSGSAMEAVGYICDFTEAHDQGGNGAYHGSLYYDNGYLVADQEGAWIVETAGRRWARRPVDGIGTISNCYSLEEDWESLDSLTEGELLRSGRGRASWRQRVQNPLYLAFTRGDTRRGLTKAALERRSENLELDGVLAALREHGSYRPGRRGSMASPCVHEGGFPVNNATTASLAVSWSGKGKPVQLWFSGTSLPCVSLFKPLILADGSFQPLWTDHDYAEGSAAAHALWAKHLEWTRMKGASALSRSAAFVQARDKAQAALSALAEEAMRELSSGRAPARIEGLRKEANAIVAAWQAGLPSYITP
jgi:hypothetical protein